MQSTKLCVFEERVLEIVAATKNLPGNLATTGELRLLASALLHFNCLP